MNAKSECIVCGNMGREIVRNDLPILICDLCGFFWRANFELSDNHYETRCFDLSNKRKIDARYSNSAKRIETFKKYADLNNLFDVGCGEGIFLKVLKDLGYKNIIGLEPSTMGLDFATIDEAKILHGNIENINESFLKENDIHTITMFHVIEHLKDPCAVVKTIYDNIKKGDKLIIETPDTNSYVLKKSNYENELIYPEHLHYFNKSNLQKLLEKSGFTVVAFGNRDFDEENMSIRESFVRLGLIKISGKTKTARNNYKGDSAVSVSGTSGILRHIARRVFSCAVHILGRGNYLWIIVEK